MPPVELIGDYRYGDRDLSLEFLVKEFYFIVESIPYVVEEIEFPLEMIFGSLCYIIWGIGE